MKKELYYCDFCKKQIEKERMYKYYIDIREYELCENCIKIASKIKDDFNARIENIYKELNSEITKLIKEEEGKNE